MNEPTEVGPANERLRRRWGVQGGQGPILTLATDAFPVTTLDQHVAPPEELYFARARRSSQQLLVTPDAGKLGMVGIFSPPGGNTLVVLERMLIRSATASMVMDLRAQQPGTTAITGTVGGTLHDSRWAGQLSTGLMGTNTTLAAAAGLLLAVPVLDATGYLDFPFVYVIAPGGNFLVFGTADQSFAVTFIWRERPMGTWEVA